MTNKQPEYDAIAQDYQEATQRLMRKYAYEPTMIRYLPPVKNRRVLDIACGDGLATRMIKSMEVKEIVGIDISEEMIKRARHFNTQDIQYYVKDAMNESITDLGTFDVVTAIMYLHYAKSKKELRQSIRNIRSVLNPNGIFYALLTNPAIQRKGYEHYGIKIAPESDIEGSEVKVELHDFDWKKYCEFTDYYWSTETFEDICREEGFETQWHAGIVSEEGRNAFLDDFWEEYDREPVYVTLTAKRIGGD